MKLIIYVIFELSLKLAHCYTFFSVFPFMGINFAFSVNWLQWIFMEYFKKVNRFTFFLSSLFFEWLLSFKIIRLHRKYLAKLLFFNIKLLYTFVIWVSTENVRNLSLFVIVSIKLTFIFDSAFEHFMEWGFFPTPICLHVGVLRMMLHGP